MALRSHIHREYTREEVGVVLPACSDVWAQRTCCPRVEHIWIPGESTRDIALIGGETLGYIGRWVDRQDCFRWENRRVVDRVAGCVDRVPDGKWNAKKSLAAHEPVSVETFNPVFVAMSHVARMPRDVVASSDKRLAKIRVASTVADVPLATGNNFERSFSAFVKLHWVFDRSWLADEFAGLGQHVDNSALCLFHGESSDLGVGVSIDTAWCIGDDSSVATDDGACRQLEFAPPNDVGDIAEGTDHCDAGSLVGLGEWVRHNRHLDSVEGCADGRSEVWLVTFVIRVSDERNTSRKQFGSGRVDDDVARSIALVKGELVVCTGSIAVFHFCLCDGGLEVDVPQGGRLSAVRLAASEIAQERPLAHAA